MSQTEILASFDTDDAHPLTAAEVIERTGLPRSTVFRGLKILIASGFVHQDRRTKRYSLGAKMLRLSTVARRQLGAEDIVAGPIIELGQRTNETVTFNIVDIPWRICSFVFEAPSDLRSVAHVGARYPLHLGAAGKVILAYLPPDVTRSILAGGPLSKHQVAAMATELETIRRAGWSTTTGERVPGASSIAAPVFVGSTIYAAITVVGPTERMRSSIARYRPLAIETAKALTQRLTARDEELVGRDGRRAGASVAPPRKRRTA